MTQAMKAHKWATFFPPLEGDEFDKLVTDIKEHGLQEPIDLFEKKILDGVNRDRACRKAGVEPRFKEFRGTEDDALDYVISKNVQRRHLTASQRAVLARELKPHLQEEARKRAHARIAAQPRGKDGKGGRFVLAASPEKDDETSRKRSHGPYWATEAGRKLGVSESEVQRADRVAREAPERLADVRAGKATLHEVETGIRVKKTREMEAVRQKDKSQEYHRRVKDFLDAVGKFRTLVKEVNHPLELAKFSGEARGFTSRLLDRTIGDLEALKEKLDGAS